MSTVEVPVPESRDQSQSASSSQSSTIAPPDGGLLAWVQVGVTFSINAFTWGQTASFGVYLAHFLAFDMFPEAKPLDYAFVGGLQFSLSMLVAPLVTPIIRKFGTQVPMLIGVALQAAGFIGASFATKISHLYLTQGVLLGLGVGFIFVPVTQILSQWFSKKVTLAIGIGSAGSGVGGILFSFGIQAMIDNISLAWSLRITAVICVVMNLLAVALIRNRHAAIRPPQLGFDTKLLVRYDVLLMLAWGFITMLGYIVLIYSMSDFSLSIDLTKSQAAAISAFLNLGTAVGRPLIGFISDRYGRMEIAGLATLVCGLSCFVIWMPAKTYAVTIFFAIVSGAVVGVFWMTVAPIAVQVAGIAEVPSLLSLIWITIVPPTLFSEVIALHLRRPGAANEYLYVQIFAGLSGVVSSGCLFELRRVTRKKNAALALETLSLVETEDELRPVEEKA